MKTIGGDSGGSFVTVIHANPDIVTTTKPLFNPRQVGRDEERARVVAILNAWRGDYTGTDEQEREIYRVLDLIIAEVNL